MNDLRSPVWSRNSDLVTCPSGGVEAPTSSDPDAHLREGCCWGPPPTTKTTNNEGSNTNMFQPTASSRVASGAALLDEVQPGWYERIRLSELVMASCFQCVLGQLYTTEAEANEPRGGGYRYARHELGLDIDAAIAHGFTTRRIGSEAQPEEFQALAQAWRELILDRRAQRQQQEQRELVYA